jgi:hypothetical protein
MRNDLLGSAKYEKSHPANESKVGMHEAVAWTDGNQHSENGTESQIYKTRFDKQV